MRNPVSEKDVSNLGKRGLRVEVWVGMNWASENCFFNIFFALNLRNGERWFIQFHSSLSSSSFAYLSFCFAFWVIVRQRVPSFVKRENQNFHSMLLISSLFYSCILFSALSCKPAVIPLPSRKKKVIMSSYCNIKFHISIIFRHLLCFLCYSFSKKMILWIQILFVYVLYIRDLMYFWYLNLFMLVFMYSHNCTEKEGKKEWYHTLSGATITMKWEYM